MLKALSVSLLALFLLTLNVNHSSAQNPAANNVAVSGKVADTTGALITGAVVTLTSSTGQISHTTTDATGNFTLSGLAAGKYRLDVVKEGFALFTDSNLQLVTGKPMTANVTLSIGTAGQSVVVYANIPGTTPALTQEDVYNTNQTIRELDRVQMDTVGPLAGSAQILSLTPGAQVTGYGNSGADKYTITINGIQQGWTGYSSAYSTAGAIAITLDGIPVSDPSTGLWQSPTIPQTDLLQNVGVTYGPGAAADRWYNNIGGGIEFTPVQPTRKPHANASFSAGSYNQLNYVGEASPGEWKGWMTVFGGGYGNGDDFRKATDGFTNPSSDYAFTTKAVKSFGENSFELGGYYGHGGGYRSQVIPVVANPLITIDGQEGSQQYSQQTSGYYSTLPFNSYNKYDTQAMGLVYSRLNAKLDATTSIMNTAWYMHIHRTHHRLNDVYNPGPQVQEWNDPSTETVGEKLGIIKVLPMNTLKAGGYFIHDNYTTQNNFFNSAMGGGPKTPNAGGKVRSGLFNQNSIAVYLQDEIRPTKNFEITPSLRFVNYQVAYSDIASQHFNIVPGSGVVLREFCALTQQTIVAGTVKDQGSVCASREARSGIEPGVDTSYHVLPWLELYGGYNVTYKSLQLGGGGGLFQSVDPASYHLAKGGYAQGGFKIHTNGSGFRKDLLITGAYYQNRYANQEIDVALSNGDTVATNGSSTYKGFNFAVDDDPISHLHAFLNMNLESSHYNGYALTQPQPGQTTQAYNGLPVAYVPNQTFNFGLYYDKQIRPGLKIIPTLSYQFIGTQNIYDNSGTFDNVPFPHPSHQTMSSYGTMNLSVKVPYKKLEFRADALNLLNSRYNEFVFISSGGYFATPTGGYNLAYPGSPVVAYFTLGAHF